ncbi:MAG: NAD-dependent deacylase [Candidatus Sericytochromatia bacterium]|nr:NAD-dependent deacylase [Candidatus Sericytochromatia bacterium]
MNTEALQNLAKAIDCSAPLVVLTGAGISAESGVRTFRDPDGYWARFDPAELASPEGFRRDPELVWRWYDARRRQLLQAQPNPGHRALVALEALCADFTLITQNVDGLHTAAGSQNVLEMHGSIWRLRCTRSTREWVSRDVFESFPVHCQCGALLRPAVLWFGEMYHQGRLQRALEAMRKAQTVLVVGTSGMVGIVSGLLDQASRQARLVEFNPNPSHISAACDTLIAGPAGESLPQLLQYIQSKTPRRP